jgi:hypothetical protein
MLDTADQVTVALAPFLPFLLEFGKSAAEVAGQKLGAEAWEQAKGIWVRLAPKVNSRPAAREAAIALAARPRDDELQTVFTVQLRRLLSEDEELRRWLEQAAGRGMSVSYDLRSGGVYFEGGSPRIEGPVTGRDSHR